MFNNPRILLHVEGAAILFLSLFFYREIHASWLLFVVLILVPDLFMLGYLHNVRTGAILYNFVHTLTVPLLFIAVLVFTAHLRLLPYALIWTAHIGLDHMLGFGLKYPTHFKDTHLQRV